MLYHRTIAPPFFLSFFWLVSKQGSFRDNDKWDNHYIPGNLKFNLQWLLALFALLFAFLFLFSDLLERTKPLKIGTMVSSARHDRNSHQSPMAQLLLSTDIKAVKFTCIQQTDSPSWMARFIYLFEGADLVDKYCWKSAGMPYFYFDVRQIFFGGEAMYSQIYSSKVFCTDCSLEWLLDNHSVGTKRNPRDNKQLGICPSAWHYGVPGLGGKLAVVIASRGDPSPKILLSLEAQWPERLTCLPNPGLL